jgi:hypothetical protein
MRGLFFCIYVFFRSLFFMFMVFLGRSPSHAGTLELYQKLPRQTRMNKGIVPMILQGFFPANPYTMEPSRKFQIKFQRPKKPPFSEPTTIQHNTNTYIQYHYKKIQHIANKLRYTLIAVQQTTTTQHKRHYDRYGTDYSNYTQSEYRAPTNDPRNGAEGRNSSVLHHPQID